MEEVDKPLQYALYLLSFRPRSKKELDARVKKKFPQADSEKIISKLEKWGYINDEEFARSWIEGRLLHNPKGRFALRRELKQKGVQEEVIEKMLRALYPVERERDEAWKLARRKWSRESGVEERKKKERTYRYLLSRGFPLEIVKEIIESLSSK